MEKLPEHANSLCVSSICNLRDDYIFHQDGAAAHYSLRVRTWLHNKRPENWIGRGGPVEWPARSPDLTPCDFFL